MWHDLDVDGVRDAGEPGLSARTLYIDADDDGVLDGGETTVTSGATGAYEFLGLVPGNYVVRQVVPGNYAQSAPAGWQSAQRITVGSGEVLTGVDFGSAYYAFRTGQKIDYPGGSDPDFFGFGPAVSGDYAVVGARGADVGANVDQGVAYLYQKSASGEWVESGSLTAPDGQPGDWLGFHTAVEGNWMAVGASHADVDGKNNAGKVYIYELDESTETWQYRDTLTAEDEAQADAEFGFSFSLRYGALVVSAPFHDIGAAADAGKAYVFRPNGEGDWNLITKLVGDVAAGAQFGWIPPSLSTDPATGDVRVAVGALGENVNAANDGAAYVFQPNGAGPWTRIAKLTTSVNAPAQDNRFGSVALDGDVLAVGANTYARPGSPGTQTGKVYIFRRNAAGSWELRAQMESPEVVNFDRFGYAVAWHNGALLVSAPFHDSGGSDAGAIYALRDDGAGNWHQVGKLNGTTNDILGLFTIDSDGVSVFASASGAGGSRGGVDGSAYAFDIVAAGHISGNVFDDRNANGVRDAGEPGLSGRTLYIDANDNGLREAGETTATSDASGAYSFSNLVPGDYIVRDILPGGTWFRTLPGGDGAYRLELGPAHHAQGIDFASGQNHPPEADPTSVTTDEDTFVDVDLWPLVSDVETPYAGLVLTVGNAVHGTVELQPDGHTARFTPYADYHGPAGFSYSVSEGGVDPITVGPVSINVNIAPVNDAPVLDSIGDQFVDALTTLQFTLSASDADTSPYYVNDFEGPNFGIQGWIWIQDSQGLSTIGFDDHFAWNNTVNANGGTIQPTILHLDNLPVHNSIDLSFLFVTIDSWDGPPAELPWTGDYFNVDVDGQSILSEAFDLLPENTPPGVILNPGGAPLWDYVTAFPGSSTFDYPDDVYDMGQHPAFNIIPHSASSLTVAWYPSGPGWQGLADESWGIDNISVSLGNLTYSAVGLPDGATLDSVTGEFSWTPTQAQARLLPYTVTFYVTDGIATVWRTIGITVNGVTNEMPMARPGGPYPVAEGASVQLDGTASFDPDQDSSTLIYEWDLDNDGNFGETGIDALNGDEVGAMPTYSAANLDGLFPPLPLPVSLKVTDNGGLYHIAGTTVDVLNVPPDAAIAGNPVAVPGEIVEFTFTACDDSTVDQDSNFTYEIEWGDGRGETIVAGHTLMTSHRFRGVHNFTVTATATDKDGGKSLAATHDIEVRPARRRGADLLIGGTSGPDIITLTFGSVHVDVNGIDAGTFDPTGEIVVYGLEGDDQILVDEAIVPRTHLFGEEGDDTLQAGGGDAVLDGGAGNDTFLAGPGANTVIGGGGSNTFIDGGGLNTFLPSAGAVAPEVFTDAYAVAENGVLTVAAAGGVLANDVNPLATNLSAILVEGPQHGTLELLLDGSFTYTPMSGYVGPDNFRYRASNGGGESDAAMVSLVISRLPDLAGRVFDDLDNDGAFESVDGEVGIAGVFMQLVNEASGGTIATTTTDADGVYRFVNLLPGTYRVEQAQQPSLYLDGREAAGSFGGSVNNTADSNTIGGIVVGAEDEDGDGYTFGEIRPSQAVGLVFEDFNNDGEVNFGERAIENVEVELTGTDDRGNPVNRSVLTDMDGVYTFIELRPGSYALRETQPAGFDDGIDTTGVVNGVPSGSVTSNDQFTGIVIARPDSNAENYNFGERPAAGGAVNGGQTATIGFWQNKHGQELITGLNGSATATQLANWLAQTLPNMYGAQAGANNLTGLTNAQVADFYRELFKRNKKSAAGGGPPKVDAQVLAVALATYVTNQTLAGMAAANYGFLVSEHGVGVATFNVGSNGQAFGVGNNSTMTILDILLATNNRSHFGILYDMDGDGDADDNLESLLRSMANNVYAAVNEQGDL